MTENSFTVRDNGVFALSGRMTFQTVPQFLAHTDEWLQSGTHEVTIDMHGLMLEWLQRARVANRQLVFTNLPEQMRHLISVNGLRQVFQLR